MKPQANTLFDLGPPPPRAKPRVMLKVIDAGPDCEGDCVILECPRCRHNTGWIEVRNKTEALSQPCPHCNSQSPKPVALQTPMPEVMHYYVVYADTLDYPGEVVCRRWTLDERGEAVPDLMLHARGRTVEEVRAAVPAGCVCLERDPRDDPKIMETWL